jgi:hypothetical protein
MYLIVSICDTIHITSKSNNITSIRYFMYKKNLPCNYNALGINIKGVKSMLLNTNPTPLFLMLLALLLKRLIF